jgi:hypothetical protein
MLDGFTSCDRVITIGTPHSGGTWAIYGIEPLRVLGFFPRTSRGKSCDQLRPRSPLYEHLNGPVYRVENCDRVDFTNVWSVTDELVLPSLTARFTRATRERVFALKGHVQLVLSPTVLRYVRDVLLAAPAPRRHRLSDPLPARAP